MDVVKEKSTAYITVDFTDQLGTPEAPTAITYEVHDLATGTELKASTAVAIPAASVEVVLEPSVNHIVRAGKDKEAHCLTVTAAYGGTNQQTGEFVFYVQALGRIT